jgi:hypothetical protein
MNYRTNATSNTSIFLAVLALCIYFFMPKTIDLKIPKDVALPVVSTLAVASIVRSLRY